jgi:MFS family permease
MAIVNSLAVLALSGSVTMAGSAHATIWIGRIVISYVSGWLMDRTTRKRVLLLGGIITTASMVGVSISFVGKELMGIFFALLLYGMGYAILSQNRIPMSDMYEQSTMGTAIGYLYTSSIIGSIVAIPMITVGDLLSTTYQISPYPSIWLLGALFLAFSIISPLMIKIDTKEVAMRLKSNNPKPDSKDSDSVISPHMSNSVIIAFIVSALNWGIMVANMAFLSLNMGQSNFSLALISTTVTLHIIGMYALSTPIGKMVDRWGAKSFMICGSTVTGAGALLTPLSANYFTITLGMFLVGVGWSIAVISTTTVIANATPIGIRGKVLGLNDLIIGITAAGITFVAGVVIAVGGPLGFGIYGLALSIPTIVPPLIMKQDSTKP